MRTREDEGGWGVERMRLGFSSSTRPGQRAGQPRSVAKGRGTSPSTLTMSCPSMRMEMMSAPVCGWAQKGGLTCTGMRTVSMIR